MIEYLTNLSNQQIMVIALAAFFCVLVFPRLIRRKRLLRTLHEEAGKDPLTADRLAKEKLLSFSHNAKKNEIEELLVPMKTYAKLNGMKIVFPGMVRSGSEVTRTTMILVAGSGLLAVRCLGFGGVVEYRKKDLGWYQTINQTERKLEDPVAVMKKDEALLREALRKKTDQKMNISSVTVFTKQDVLLLNLPDVPVFRRDAFQEWLAGSEDLLKDRSVDVDRTAELLVSMVKSRNEAD